MTDKDRILIEELKTQIKAELLENIKENLKLKVKLHPNASKESFQYQSEFASGIDLRAGLFDPNTGVAGSVILHPNSITIIDTGISIQIPFGYEAQIRSRSGLSTKGIVVSNSPGTIDQDYTGEIKVILANNNKTAYKVEHSDRIAQLVIAPVVQPKIEFVEEIQETKRGDKGFGSTGLK